MSEYDIDLSDMAYTTLTSPSSWATATVTAGATGTSSGLYTVAGSNGSSNWTDTVTISSSVGRQASLHVQGDANFEGDVKIAGKSIADSIDRIEERLAILRPNEELEEKWENLRGLRKMYMDLEAEIIEKEKMWGILKK